MFTLNKRNIIALLLASLITIGFLWCVFTPPSLFNALPFEIHESMHSNLSSENIFIRQFDVFSAIILFVLSYIILRNCFKTFDLF